MCATAFRINIDQICWLKNIESSWVEVDRLESKKLVVGRVYRPPNACSDTFIDLLNDSFSKLPVGSQIVLLGDFNIDFLAQKNGASFKLKRQLRQFAIANDLEQLINSPTRICEQTRTAIDLVFVKNTHRIVESGVLHSAISDHSFVYCTMKSGVPKHLPKTIEYRSYRKYDKSSFIFLFVFIIYFILLFVFPTCLFEMEWQ